jgi:pimeloyl-ACP methyl ester carboxylesterase
MKDFFHILLTGVATGLVAFIGFLPTVRAETIITDGFLQGDTTWDKVHSPYVLADVVTVSSGMTLTIEAGVEVRADPSSEYDPYIYVAGNLQILGSAGDPVRISDIWGITIDHGRADISQADFSMKGSLMLSGSEGLVSTSTIANAVDGSVADGITIENGKVTIRGSKIHDNLKGISIKDSGGVFQVRTDNVFQRILNGTGLIKTVHAALQEPSQVSVVGSSLLDNAQASIVNNTSIEVQAAHNWWGSTGGPQTGATQGPVAYEPWLDHDPFDAPAVSCCSSILFLPGLEASRLYRDEPGMLGIGTTTNRLWEPNKNADVRKLFLKPDGSSVDPSVYAGGPLGKALGIKDIYGSFMNFLDGMSQRGTIKEWKSFGYDWRKPIVEVVAGRERRATTTESLIETIEGLASRSKTGKVTLIAHSNGGLVAKYLVKTLVDSGKEGLIDSVISVAVPYLGTPQAILGLLHGDNQSIFGGLILRKSVAKELGINMSSAYSLIPSADYFSKVFGPTIAYASATSAPAIDSAAGQNFFIGSRANMTLTKAAETLHAIIDPFLWPAQIARWAIVGWGNRTAKGIVYSDANTTKYTATTTTMGDGTVVAPSAAYNAGTTTAINLASVSETEHRDIDHANMLGSSVTQKTIEHLITTDNHNNNAKGIEQELVKIPGVTIGEPNYTQETAFLVVSTHSPVELHLYDRQGRHTGIAPIPAGTDEEIEDGLFTYTEKNIPGSSFELYGDEDEPETYISVPDTGGQTYSVSIQGTGVGEFSYNVERVRGGTILDSALFSSLPVTPLMTASTTVTTQTMGTSTPAKLASSTPVLKIDIDGNGSVDITAKVDAPADPIVFLESLRKVITQLIGSNTRAKNVNKRIDRLEELVKKGKYKKAAVVANRLKKVVAHKKAKVLTAAEKEEIVDLIDTFLAQFE